jgi:hypothetical protein
MTFAATVPTRNLPLAVYHDPVQIVRSCVPGVAPACVPDELVVTERAEEAVGLVAARLSSADRPRSRPPSRKRRWPGHPLSGSRCPRRRGAASSSRAALAPCASRSATSATRRISSGYSHPAARPMRDTVVRGSGWFTSRSRFARPSTRMSAAKLFPASSARRSQPGDRDGRRTAAIWRQQVGCRDPRGWTPLAA